MEIWDRNTFVILVHVATAFKNHYSFVALSSSFETHIHTRNRGGMDKK